MKSLPRRPVLAAFFCALLGGCTLTGTNAGQLAPVSVTCQGKFTASIVGPAGMGVSGDCGDGASFTITRPAAP